ncbi:EmrB/QacA subfamily drug resistance transporter [Ruminiclostridium sufflavum DSM 19573]|uniref:EmrB/QacA subfamily drug resistance transporter n=1 Tax=Ruminiclostridium sufflavum DSM 19573 TaxID=1121337 RepID=A0A318Y5G7_9FIRM|nr:MFS transporter [Ruminiclostridium sufflavum]PYG87231.1 EmrB/QacA subfamily drug resistance transporter [Ruminiclostridium sufflavum DSM 19573]
MDATIERGNKNKWMILFIVLMVTFMATLDGSIVNVALPVMTKALNVTSASIQLVVTSYLIIISATILVFGRLGDMVGKTRIFKFGIALFTLGSLLCGITGSFSVLILSRVIQAIGAAGTMANNQGIITEVFPANERGKALGITGTFVALGSLLGPPIGGFIVDSGRWEYIFLINVPIGIATLFFSFKILPDSIRRVKEKLDGFGAVLFLFFIVPLFAALGKGQEVGFTKPVVLLGFLVAIAALVLFIIAERKQENPLLQLKIFENKLFSLSIFCAFLSFLAIFCSNIIQPFYLQDVMSFSPSTTGLIMMIYPLVMSVVAPVSGHLSDKLGSEVLTLIGLSFTSLGLILMSTLTEQSSIMSMALFIAIMSMGNGLFQAPNNSLVMSTVSRDKLGIAGSVNALIRNLGMICGIALSTTVLYNRMSYKIGHHVTDFVPGRNDAFIYGMRTVYIIAAVICLAGAALTAIRLFGRKSEEETVLE